MEHTQGCEENQRDENDVDQFIPIRIRKYGVHWVVVVDGVAEIELTEIERVIGNSDDGFHGGGSNGAGLSS